MRNERAPRTLADCSWTTGYTSANPRPRQWPRDWKSYALAVAVGVALALTIAYGS